MTAPSDVVGTLAMVFRPHLHNLKSKRTAQWRAAGFMPASRLRIELPKDLLPDIAAITLVHRRGSDEAVVIELWNEGLTDDDTLGAELLCHESSTVQPAHVVTRERARQRFDEWQSKATRPRLKVVS